MGQQCRILQHPVGEGVGGVSCKSRSLTIEINSKKVINNLVEAHCYGIGRTGQIVEQSRSSEKQIQRYDREGLRQYCNWRRPSQSKRLHSICFSLLRDCSTIWRHQTRDTLTGVIHSMYATSETVYVVLTVVSLAFTQHCSGSQDLA